MLIQCRKVSATSTYYKSDFMWPSMTFEVILHIIKKNCLYNVSIFINFHLGIELWDVEEITFSTDFGNGVKRVFQIWLKIMDLEMIDNEHFDLDQFLFSEDDKVKHDR